MPHVLVPTRPRHHRQGLGVTELFFAVLVGATAYLVNALQRVSDERAKGVVISIHEVWRDELQITATLGFALFFVSASYLLYCRYDAARLSSTVPALASYLSKLYVILIVLILFLGHADKLIPKAGGGPGLGVLNAFTATVVGLIETIHDIWIARAFRSTYFRYLEEAKIYRRAATWNLGLFLLGLLLTLLAFYAATADSPPKEVQALSAAHAFFWGGLAITGADVCVMLIARFKILKLEGK